jgi:hypothetical protein
MTAISKVVLLLVISAALTLSGSLVFAKSGGSPGQVKTSGTSATPSGASGSQSKTRQCYYHHCVTVPRNGITSGGVGGPNRGPGNPTLHPK